MKTKILFLVSFFFIAGLQTSTSQTVSISADSYKQQFIGVGGSVGNYFNKYFSNSEADREQICRWLADDLHYRYLKSYDGDKHPNDAPDYYDDRATFLNDLRVYKSDIEFVVCFNQVSKMYQSRMDADEPGIFNLVAQRYFDILEAYHLRNASVSIIELLNEPGGAGEVLRQGVVYAYAVPILRNLISNSSSNPHGVPMPKIAGTGTWGVGQLPHWINKFKSKLPDAWNNLEIVTTHGYSGGWKTNLFKDVYNIIDGKPFYNSEQTGKAHKGDDIWEQEQSGTIDEYIAGALSMSQIYICGMLGYTNAFFAFQNYNTSDNNAALLQVTNGNSPKTKKMYYALKQITSLQPEGCHRVGRDISSMSKIKTLVMRKKGENYVYLHMANIRPEAKTITINFKNGASYNIKSVKSWVTDEFGNDATQTMNKKYSRARSSINIDIAAHSITTLKLEIESASKKSAANAIGTDLVQEIGNVSSYRFANPVKDVLNITGATEISKIEVYSLLGEKVLTSQNSKNVSVEHLSKGTYLLVVNGVEAMKFVKE